MSWGTSHEGYIFMLQNIARVNISVMSYQEMVQLYVHINAVVAFEDNIDNLKKLKLKG